MIFDHRVFTTHPGKPREHVAIYKEFGWEVQSEIFGPPVLFASTDAGETNAFYHIWAFESFQDRAEKRDRLVNDPRWHEYRRRFTEAGTLAHQQNSILVPVSFL